MYRIVAIGESGSRVGEDKYGAKLTNADVELVRELHSLHGKSYGWLAKCFGVSRSLIAQICRYQKRATLPVDWRRVR